MKKKILKVFFYVLATSLNFFGIFKTSSSAMMLYGVERPIPEPEPNLLLVLIDYLLLGLSFIFAPIVFFVGLYFFIKKETEKKNIKKGITYIILAILLFVIFYIGKEFLDYIFPGNFYN